ncbi:MAG: tetratricopeptide repeat protein [Planctomycetes bacterium]|nr:tetratricopeptide repeat protein [Planctomycetota bacterium]
MIKEHYAISAEGYLHLAKLGITEDDLYGLSLWKAASNYDKAGDVEHAIAVWQRVVKEREGKSRWPMGVFNLAQSYRSVGSYDEAVEYFQILREKYPRSPAALGSAVPLAKSYLSKDPPEPGRAEKLLREVLKDRALTPLAPAYREALFVLGDLHYDEGEFPKAINVFTEAIDRYPTDSQLGKAMFLVGDSYRKSGLALDQALANLSLDPTAVVLEAETSGLRRNYLDQGRDYFSRAIRFYEGIPEGRLSRLDKLYLRHCWLYRADCLFDLGRYAESVLAYEETALRYQLTPTALASFVQIINAQVRLGQHLEAKSAKERAVWQLRKMPDEAFGGVSNRFTRQEWQGRFDWLDRSGFW